MKSRWSNPGPLRRLIREGEESGQPYAWNRESIMIKARARARGNLARLRQAIQAGIDSPDIVAFDMKRLIKRLQRRGKI